MLSVLFNVTSPDNKLNHTRCRLYTTFFFLFVLLPLFDLCLFACRLAVMPDTKPQELCHKIIIVSFPFLAVFFVLSWLVSPGYMKENKKLEEAVECLAKYPSEPHKVCPDCLVRGRLLADRQAEEVQALRRVRQVRDGIRPPLPLPPQLRRSEKREVLRAAAPVAELRADQHLHPLLQRYPQVTQSSSTKRSSPKAASTTSTWSACLTARRYSSTWRS